MGPCEESARSRSGRIEPRRCGPAGRFLVAFSLQERFDGSPKALERLVRARLRLQSTLSIDEKVRGVMCRGSVNFGYLALVREKRVAYFDLADAQGRRCNERQSLEFHHREPFARGGGHNPDNIQLMSPTHNQYLAKCNYGKEVMERLRRSSSRAREPGPVYSLTH